MGIHDINDVLPIAVLDAGALLWLVRGRRTSPSKIEREVMGLVVRGLSNAEIRNELYLSEPTVKTHVGRILMKPGRERGSGVRRPARLKAGDMAT